jgi:hypothetical protein
MKVVRTLLPDPLTVPINRPLERESSAFITLFTALARARVNRARAPAFAFFVASGLLIPTVCVFNQIT